MYNRSTAITANSSLRAYFTDLYRKTMTLKERFRQELTGHLSDEKTEVDVNIATRIAEEFAIGFAEWVLDRFTFKDFIHKEPKELLEIYKKESYGKNL